MFFYDKIMDFLGKAKALNLLFLVLAKVLIPSHGKLFAQLERMGINVTT